MFRFSNFCKVPLRTHIVFLNLSYSLNFLKSLQIGLVNFQISANLKIPLLLKVAKFAINRI